MGDEWRDRVIGRWLIGQDHIEAEAGQCLMQLDRSAGAQDDLHIRAVEDRLQKPDLEIPGQGCQRPDAQGLAVAAGGVQRADQFFTGGEDCIGIIKGDPSGLGQVQLSPASFEQFLTELFLQLADLYRQR